MKLTGKQKQLADLLESKGSVDLLDLQRGIHGVRTTNPASVIYELRLKGYDITTHENRAKDNTYISTVYKLNYLPLPENITIKDQTIIQRLRRERTELKKQLKDLKEKEESILKKY